MIVFWKVEELLGIFRQHDEPLGAPLSSYLEGALYKLIYR